MAAKKSNKQTKPVSTGRIFFGDELYHECEYRDSEETVFHDDSITDRFEATLSQRLTEAVRSIIARNPDSELVKLFDLS